MSAHHHDPEEDRPAERMDWRLWRRLVGYTLRYRRWTLMLIGCAIATGTVDGLFNLVVGRIVDAATDPGGDVVRWLCAYAGLIVLLCLLVRTFVSLGGRIRAHVAHDIRAEAFANVQRLSLDYFDKRPVGWLLARQTSDCDRLSQALSWGLLDIAWGLTTMTVSALAMLWLDLRLGLIALSVVPVLWVASLWFQRRILRTARQVRGLNSRLTAAYDETLSGVATVRAFGAQTGFQSRFEELTGSMRRRSVANANLSALYLPLVLSLAGLAGGLCLGFGGVSVFDGAISVGTLVAFLGYSRQFFEPLQEMAAWFCEFQMAQASAERVFGLIDEVPTVKDTPRALERLAAASERAGADGSAPDGLAPDGLPPRIGELRLEGVHFRYGDGPDVLAGLDLVIPEGATVALVGPTGGGKTTLTSLLCRFREPTRGRLVTSGVEYRERSLAWWQEQLGVVLQEPHLFSGTLADNLRYAKPGATDAELVEVARLAQLDRVLESHPDGFETQVGAGGARLSMGERQLVSLARALLADPQLLVMDEATSSVDTATERRLQAAVEQALVGRTAVVVAHRLSTIRGADLIVVIEGGRIVESGTHTELLERRGRYAELEALSR
ncbi:putative ABC transporter ATP-binding protein [Planctomycetes bacterium Pla163]|uniref:Putative ABC transporter ATP-binding protein n=1 Tax=Rohdeia mirabilis TaxID=2528008 RepID=A0A518CYT3_9BACT|nr:putative ABC transporter ATP-binding protein [Planctomycetes bacterium Pla163]